MKDAKQPYPDLAEDDATEFVDKNQLHPWAKPRPEAEPRGARKNSLIITLITYLCVAAFLFLGIAAILNAVNRHSPSNTPAPTVNSSGSNGLDSQTKEQLQKCGNTIKTISGNC